MGLGVLFLSWYSPSWRRLAKLCLGEYSPFPMGKFPNVITSSVMVTIVAGLLGVFLIIQNLSLSVMVLLTSHLVVLRLQWYWVLQVLFGMRFYSV